MFARLEPIAAAIVTGYAQPEVATIGENLGRIRDKRDQKKIAARMGVPQAQVSNWEKNRYRTMTAKNLIKLALGYECSVGQILEGVDGYSDLLWQSGMRASGRQLNVESPNASASARVLPLLQDLVATIATQETTNSKMRELATELLDVTAAGPEGDSVADATSASGGRDRKTDR